MDQGTWKRIHASSSPSRRLLRRRRGHHTRHTREVGTKVGLHFGESGFSSELLCPSTVVVEEVDRWIQIPTPNFPTQPKPCNLTQPPPSSELFLLRASPYLPIPSLPFPSIPLPALDPRSSTPDPRPSLLFRLRLRLPRVSSQVPVCPVLAPSPSVPQPAGISIEVSIKKKQRNSRKKFPHRWSTIGSIVE